jgi:hypothetical protein
VFVGIDLIAMEGLAVGGDGYISGLPMMVHGSREGSSRPSTTSRIWRQGSRYGTAYYRWCGLNIARSQRTPGNPTG